MDARTRSIIVGAAALFLVASIFGIALYLGRVSNTENTSSADNSLSNLPVITAPGSSSSDSSSPTSVPTRSSNSKTYIGSSFSLQYPSSWGVLTCNNSQNFELDPTSGSDAKNIACDRAVKPVTVLLTNSINCPGQLIKIGDHQVFKSKNTNGSDVNYRWCLNVGGKNFDITHRVSSSGSKATSKDDFSTQIEQLIQSIQSTPRAS